MNYKWVNEIKEITDSFFNNVIKTLHKNNFLTNLFPYSLNPLFPSESHSERSEESLNEILRLKPQDGGAVNTFDDNHHAAFTLAAGATHVCMSNNNRRVAFTLAEVLITLGIIGVVAALTIPTLMSNYREKLLVNQLKKINSTLAQSLTLAEVQNGNIGEIKVTLNVAEKLFDAYWVPYFKMAKLCNDSYSTCGYASNMPFKSPKSYSDSLLVWNPQSRKAFLGQDGAFYLVCFFIVSDDTGLPVLDKNYIVVDLNGSKEPNVVGKDVFFFEYKSGKSVFPYGYNKSDSEIKQDCLVTGRSCTEVIKRSGWKIPDWYPVKV